ncbi:MAG: AAA family ATPase, partial [Planctomycetes bacterium]|nr:AAA family ATPase [Planctomycetota bacterium]
AFAREAQAGSSVDDEGLVRVYATGESDGRPWIALQFVPGIDLRRVLDERGALPEPHLRRAAQRLASALAALHAAGWVHGDLKPENLRMDDEGRVVLIDLGFARRPGDKETKHLRAGSPAYLSPEQDAGDEGDQRSEVHTLGQVLYELAVGRHPFADEHGKVDAELARRRKRGDQALASHHYPGLSPFLDLLLAEMLDVDPAHRPSAAQVAERFADRETSSWWRSQLAGRRRTRLGGGRRHLIPLVGRRQELEALTETWARVAESGRAEVVHLIGPSGSGKSRLVSELAEVARRSERPPMVLYGRAHEEEERRPCEPILGWLRRALLLPTGAPPGPREEMELRMLVPPAETIALLEALDPTSESRTPAAVPVALAAWLGALSRERPLLLFFDDLGWADEGSLEVLARAAQALADAQVNVNCVSQTLRQVNMQFIIERSDYKQAIIALNHSLCVIPGMPVPRA